MQIKEEIGLAIFKPRSMGDLEGSCWPSNRDLLVEEDQGKAKCPRCFRPVLMTITNVWRHEWPLHCWMIRWKEGFCHTCQKLVHTKADEELLSSQDMLYYYTAVVGTYKEFATKWKSQIIENLPTREALAIHVETWLHRAAWSSENLRDEFSMLCANVLVEALDLSEVHPDDRLMLIFYDRMRQWFAIPMSAV